MKPKKGKRPTPPALYVQKLLEMQMQQKLAKLRDNNHVQAMKDGATLANADMMAVAASIPGRSKLLRYRCGAGWRSYLLLLLFIRSYERRKSNLKACSTKKNNALKCWCKLAFNKNLCNIARVFHLSLRKFSSQLPPQQMPEQFRSERFFNRIQQRSPPATNERCGQHRHGSTKYFQQAGLSKRFILKAMVTASSWKTCRKNLAAPKPGAGAYQRPCVRARQMRNVRITAASRQTAQR